MRKKIALAVAGLIIAVGAVAAVFIFNVGGIKDTKVKPWFREMSLTIETGSILHIADDVSLYWNGDNRNQPSLQHGPIVFNNSYSDARLFVSKKGTVTIRNPHKVIHQKEIGEQDSASLYRFSPDFQRFYYVLRRWNEPGVSSIYTVVTNDWTSDEYDSISQPVFSADGKHLAFVTQKASAPSIVAGVPRTRTTEVILDGKSVASYDSQTINELDMSRPQTSFNPVNNKLAYYIKDQTFDERTRGNSFVVYDGTQGPTFDYIDEAPVFSENGSSIAYGAYKRGLFLSVHSTVNNESTVVCNGSEGPAAGYVGDIALSKDGSICGYIGRQGDGPQKNFVVINGKIVNQSETTSFSNLQIGEKGTIAYSIGDCRVGGDGCTTQIGDKSVQRWGFLKLASKDEVPIFEVIKLTDKSKADALEPLKGTALAIDSEVGKTADTIHDVILDSDRRIVAYVAEIGSKKYLMVGASYVGPYDDIWPPIFEKDALVFGARSGKNVLRVSVQMQEQSAESKERDHSVSQTNSSNNSLAGNQPSLKGSQPKQWKSILYNAPEAAKYWMDQRNVAGGLTISWLDASQPLPAMDAVDLLKLNGKLEPTVAHISSLVSKNAMTLTASGGEISDGKITHWGRQGEATTTPLDKPLEKYIEEALRNGLNFLLVGTVQDGKLAKSDVYFMSAGCFRDSQDTFACDSSSQMVLVTSDHHFLRLTQYSDGDYDIGALAFLENSDVGVLNAFNPPVVPTPNSQIPLVNIATSRDRSPISNGYGNSLKSAFKDPTTGVEIFTMGDECCIAKNNNGTWGVYQFDFDQMALRSQSQKDILSAPALSTGVLYFTKNDGSPNEEGYTHNSTASCGGEVPSYELRFSKVSNDELSKGYEQIGTTADNIPVYRNILTQQQIDQPSKDDWLYGFYLQRFTYGGAENTANWKVFYDSIPVIWIPDPLGGLVGFVNSRYPFPAECEGRSNFNGPQW